MRHIGIVECEAFVREAVRSRSRFYGPFEDGWKEAIRSLIDDCPATPERVLSIGPGEGYEVEVLHERGHQVEVLDFWAQPELQALCERLGVPIQIGEMESPPWERETFGGVFAHHVLEHALSPLLALCEWSSILRMGGWLAIGVPPAENECINLHLSNLPAPYMAYLMAVAGFDVRNAVLSVRGYDNRWVVRKVAEPLQTLMVHEMLDRLPPGAVRQRPDGPPVVIDDVWV